MKKQRHLSTILHQARAAEPLVSAAETEQILHAVETRRGSRIKRRWKQWGGALGIGMAVLAVVVWQVQQHGLISSGKPSVSAHDAPNGRAHPPRFPAKGENIDTFIEYHFRVPGKRQRIPPYLQNKNIAGVRVLSLTSDELLGLGLRGLPDGSVQHYQGRKTFALPKNRRMGFSPVLGVSPSKRYLSLLTITRTGQGYVWIPDEELPIPLRSPVYPRLVTDAEGRTRLARFVFKNITEERLALVERSLDIHALLPVFVPCGKPSADSSHEREGYIFWYETTPELLQALPQRIREQLVPETKVAAQVRQQMMRAVRDSRPVPMPAVVLQAETATGEHSAEAIPHANQPRLTGDDAVYYDMWRSAVGAITSSLLYPNPVQGLATTVRYTLEEERGLTITLHEVSGTCIAELLPPQKRARGEHNERVALPQGLAAGLYLVVLQSNRGEHAVQRLIVQ